MISPPETRKKRTPATMEHGAGRLAQSRIQVTTPHRMVKQCPSTMRRWWACHARLWKLYHSTGRLLHRDAAMRLAVAIREMGVGA